MSTVRDLLARKGHAVVSVSPESTVLAAAELMNARAIGGLLVMHDDTLVGIFSERDIMRRVVALQRDPAATVVRDVMTTPVVTTTPEAAVTDCRAMMTARRIRHLPVCSDREVVGLITTGDILAYEVSLQETQIHDLERFVFNLR
jgi:CBS domain-containing protein